MNIEQPEQNNDETRYVEAENEKQACEFLNIEPHKVRKVEKIGRGRGNRNIYRLAA